MIKYYRLPFNRKSNKSFSRNIGCSKMLQLAQREYSKYGHFTRDVLEQTISRNATLSWPPEDFLIFISVELFKKYGLWKQNQNLEELKRNVINENRVFQIELFKLLCSISSCNRKDEIGGHLCPHHFQVIKLPSLLFLNMYLLVLRTIIFF